MGDCNYNHLVTYTVTVPVTAVSALGRRADFLLHHNTECIDMEDPEI